MAGPNSYIDLGRIGSGALFAATHAPGIPGAIATAAQLGMRAYNVYNGDQIRQGLGMPGQSVGQWIGGILGLNDRGRLDGNNVIANRHEFANPYNGSHAAVTTGGLYDNGGFFGRMLANLVGDYADLKTAYTPEEARLRQIAAANYGSAPQAAPAAAPAAASVPITRADGTIIGYYNPNDGSTSSAAAQNAVGFSGGGAAGTPQGGQYGNNGINTGGMAGPVNRNQATGMLSRI